MRTGWSPRRRRRQATTLVALLAGLAAVVAGGSVWTPQSATVSAARVPLVGRTTTVCAVTPEVAPTTSLTTMAIRQAPGREGLLSASPIGGTEPLTRLTEQGKAARLPAPPAPVVLRGEGVMATAGSGAVFSAAADGATAGLMAASCTPPTTSHWFAGIGVDPENRTDLILTNPNDAKAVVDLRFYGPKGIVVVPGSPAVVVEANSTRTVGLEPIVDVVGPLTVSVRASEGRVSVKALNQRAAASVPAGADWHVASIAPRRTVVIPGVPEGAGERQLVLTNPGRVRATVAVEVLGLQGPFAPAGAEAVEVGPESTTTVDLQAGLAGQSGTIRLRSDQPVTGAIAASSARQGAQPDVALLAATAPLVRAGVAAVATTEQAEAELVVSNAGDEPARISLEVLSYTGVSLRTDSVLLIPGATSTRRLTSPAPSYLVVGVPDGSAVHGGVVLSQPEGPVAGLTTLQVTSPDVASRAPTIRADPGVAR